jgi:hypothetical protein
MQAALSVQEEKNVLKYAFLWLSKLVCGGTLRRSWSELDQFVEWYLPLKKKYTGENLRRRVRAVSDLPEMVPFTSVTFFLDNDGAQLYRLLQSVQKNVGVTEFSNKLRELAGIFFRCPAFTKHHGNLHYC